jgi:hypothetical protein
MKSLVAFTLCLFSSSLGAFAQAPEVASFFPPGGQRGQTVSVRITGKALQGCQALISGSGVTCSSTTVDPSGNSAELKLQIASEAWIGPHEVRLANAKGAARADCFWVDAYPDTEEREPNDVVAKAQPITPTPTVINGTFQSPSDRDTYEFSAEAGQIWVFDLVAARIRSQADGVLELRDSAGKLLKMVQSSWEHDPRLIHKFATPGKYFLTVRDTQFQGSARHTYRLTAGLVPTFTTFSPTGERPGHTIGVQYDGYNIGPKGRVLIPVPADAPNGPFWVAPNTEKGFALPIQLFVSNSPAISITETDQNMQVPAMPAHLDGLFYKYPRIRFNFPADPSTPLEIDMLADRIGSRVDGALRILDSTGKVVAENDDGEVRDGRLSAEKDPRLVFKAPAAGQYTVEARNVDGKMGDNCYYRLSIKPVSPDFRLTLPAMQVRISPGGTTTFEVNAARINGYQGPIELILPGLPPGVEIRGATIGAGLSSTYVTLTSPDNIPSGVLSLQVKGVAQINNSTVEREAKQVESYVPRFIDPALFTDDGPPKIQRTWDVLPLIMSASPDPVRLKVSVNDAKLAPGGKIEITVSAVRTGYDDKIDIDLSGLPAKVSPGKVTIPKGQSELKITLAAAGDAPNATHSVVLRTSSGGMEAATPAISVTVAK